MNEKREQKSLSEKNAERGESMTAKEYLEQVRTLDALINAKQAEIDGLRQNAESISSPRLADKVQSDGGDPMKIIDKIVDMQIQINLEIDRLVDLKAEVRASIAKVYNKSFVTLLTDRYINGLTLEEIAEKMDKDYRTICRWHGEALQIFRKENNLN